MDGLLDSLVQETSEYLNGPCLLLITPLKNTIRVHQIWLKFTKKTLFEHKCFIQECAVWSKPTFFLIHVLYGIRLNVFILLYRKHWQLLFQVVMIKDTLSFSCCDLLNFISVAYLKHSQTSVFYLKMISQSNIIWFYIQKLPTLITLYTRSTLTFFFFFFFYQFYKHGTKKNTFSPNLLVSVWVTDIQFKLNYFKIELV